MTKDELKINFEEIMTMIAESLREARVSQKEINRFVYMPARINEFRKFIKWVKDNLLSKVDRFESIWSTKLPGEWESLRMISNFHVDIKRLDGSSKEIRKMWRLRPRGKIV